MFKIIFHLPLLVLPGFTFLWLVLAHFATVKLNDDARFLDRRNF